MTEGEYWPQVNLTHVARLIDEREFSPQHQRRAIMLADSSVPLVTAFAKAYTRGRGFDVNGEPNEEIAAVITTASARLGSNTARSRCSPRSGSGPGASAWTPWLSRPGTARSGPPSVDVTL